MIRARVIPCLLLKDGGLVKTMRFSNPRYIGDPINAVKIYNAKEVDELIFLDITATKEKREPNYDLIKEIAEECFMPFSYGGGIRSIASIKKLLRLGVEKVILNTASHENPTLVREAVNMFGSSTVIASIDVKKNFLGKYKRYIRAGKKSVAGDIRDCVRDLEALGVGEIFINSIDRDGTMAGYDIELVRDLAERVSIPVIACGGAGTLNDVREVLQRTGISAAAAGSIFVYHGKIKGVLINYPNRATLDQLNILQHS